MTCGQVRGEPVDHCKIVTVREHSITRGNHPGCLGNADGMATYNATAARTDDGWVVAVDGVGATQASTLADAGPLAADMVEGRLAVDPATIQVVVRIQLPKNILDAIENRHAATGRRDQDPQWYAEADLQARRLLRDYGIGEPDVDAVLGSAGTQPE